jgi:hypothetical protein
MMSDTEDPLIRVALMALCIALKSIHTAPVENVLTTYV